MDTDDCEVVRCVCEVDEENDFMIQVTHVNVTVNVFVVYVCMYMYSAVKKVFAPFLIVFLLIGHT